MLMVNSMVVCFLVLIIFLLVRSVADSKTPTLVPAKLILATVLTLLLFSRLA